MNEYDVYYVNLTTKELIPDLMVGWCHDNCEIWDFECNASVTCWTFMFSSEEDKVKFILRWM